MNKIELLAPAGDLNRAKVAYLYGADAVYVGGKRFSLRARASNFEMEDLKEAAKFAHNLGKKLYVTVNMIAHEEDLDGLETYLIELDQIKVDAIIVASLAIAQICQRLKLNFEVHLSTQLSITNSLTLEFYKSFGVSRVVLARELDHHAIEAITKKSSLPTEVFIHGGMCVNYSGRCTLSNEMTLRDANRGGCAQTCRWHYNLTQNGNLLSPEDDLFTMGSKDMETLDEIEHLIRSGVISLKIEGRMKSAYYIAIIVKAYRQWIDALVDGTANENLRTQLKDELKMAESRPTFEGFLTALPKKNGQVYTRSDDNVTQNFIGNVRSVDQDKALIEIRNHVKLHEILEVFSPNRTTQSFELTELFDAQGTSLEFANQPLAQLTMFIPCEVQVGDFIRRKVKL